MAIATTGDPVHLGGLPRPNSVDKVASNEKCEMETMSVIEMICVAAEQPAGGNLGFSKVKEVRTETDRKLIRIIDSDLDLGIRAAHQALDFSGRWTVRAEQSYSRAERAHAEVSRLLPLMYEVARDELDKCEVRFRHLGELLKALATICSTSIKDAATGPGDSRR